MRRLSIFPLFLCCLVGAVFTGNIVAAQELVEEIDAVMNEFVELDQFSGTALVARDGDILYAKAFGEANRDHGVANVLETRFNIGSIGKTITGVAIMQLVERGKLRLDAPVALYVAGFAEAYLETGDRAAAIRYYGKALEVDPEFTHAREVLERLKAEE